MAQWNIGIRKTASMAGDFIFHTRTGSQTNAQRLKITHGGDLVIPTDNAKLQIGESQDLQLYHTGSANHIDSVNGALAIRSDVFQISTLDGTHVYLNIPTDEQGVELYYDNSKKLETTSTGVDITGNLHLDNLPDTTTNSYLKIAIQDTDGVLKSDDSIKINPAQNALLVDGLFLASQTIRSTATSFTLTTANASGTVDLVVKGTHIECNGNFLPATDSTDNLGADATRWANVYADDIDVGGAVGAGQVNITGTLPKLRLIDSNNTPSYSLRNNNGTFEVYDDNAPGARFTIDDAKLVSKLNHDFDSGIDVTGNITVTGTVDGRDVNTDGGKLDGIEDNATRDQTSTEIKSLLASDKLTASHIADQAVTLAKLEHGTSSNDGKFLRANNGGDPTFESVASAEVYGFNTDSNGNLIVTTTNGGVDNISGTDYDAFDEVVFAATGFTFSVNASGNLIATI